MKRVMLAVAMAILAVPMVALGQNPIQWVGNARAGIDRAHEQQLPVMFWVTESSNLFDDSDLRDAQTESFRDPIVVAIADHHFVPVRVARNSRVLEEAQRLGLPTTHGLFVALVRSDGQVLDQIDPGVVANPEMFAERLTAAFRRYRDALYQDTLKSIVANPESPKEDVRRALQTVWRLNILSADQDIVRLLDRKDLVPAERSRLYSMLASFATKPAVDALLSLAAAGDRDAAAALGRAEAGALEFLIPELPTAEEATERQVAAYEAAARIARWSQRRPATFWTTASAEVRTRELDALRSRATSVLEFWQERNGRWR